MDVSETDILQLSRALNSLQRERDALEQKYIATLNRNNDLWNAAMKIPSALEVFRKLKP